MAITTMDGLVAGFKPFGEDVIKTSFSNKAAGTPCTPFYQAGRPGAATAYSGGLNGATLTSYAGQIPIPAPVSGQSIYLGRFEFIHAGGIGGCTLIDRLWHNSIPAMTTTTAQTITFPGLPARDQTGGTNGSGVMLAIEISTTATGNTGAISNTTVTYTNDQGATGRTATIPSFPITANPGTFIPFNLQAGDNGIRAVTAVTLGTSYVSGTIHLVLYREMASMGSPITNVGVQAGPIELGLPIIYDNAVLQEIFTPIGTSCGVTNAQFTFAQG